MLHIDCCVDESIVIGDEIRVSAVEISETEVRLALTGVDDRRLDFAIERPAAEHSSGGHVRVRTTR